MIERGLMFSQGKDLKLSCIGPLPPGRVCNMSILFLKNIVRHGLQLMEVQVTVDITVIHLAYKYTYIYHAFDLLL